MKHFSIGLVAVVILTLAAMFSVIGAPRQGDLQATKDQPQLDVRVEDRNPWTHLEMNNTARNFQFAIVTDRTGGHRPGVFQQAVEKLNLLQPEFVVSVGDLIEGNTRDRGKWALDWSEFQRMVFQLEMPFFYVPGNHDMGNPIMVDFWDRKFGRSYYHFRYHDVLFLCLNSEDPPKMNPYHFSQQQRRWAIDVLRRNTDVRWTYVLMHKPTWTYTDTDPETAGWAVIERELGDRPYTVFSGHLHAYAKYVRNGRDYYTFATTGGESKLRGKAAGEFDHVVWVTVKDDGPVIANVMLDGVEDKNIRTLPNP